MFSAVLFLNESSLLRTVSALEFILLIVTSKKEYNAGIHTGLIYII